MACWSGKAMLCIWSRSGSSITAPCSASLKRRAATFIKAMTRRELETVERAHRPHIDVRLPGGRTVADVVEALEFRAHTDHLGDVELGAETQHGLYTCLVRIEPSRRWQINFQPRRRESTLEQNAKAIGERITADRRQAECRRV